MIRCCTRIVCHTCGVRMKSLIVINNWNYKHDRMTFYLRQKKIQALFNDVRKLILLKYLKIKFYFSDVIANKYRDSSCKIVKWRK